jgi:hypothetical protein
MAWGWIVPLRSFAGQNSANCEMTFKIRGLSQEQVPPKVKPPVDKSLNVRNTEWLAPPVFL